jgi:hypothetical protein
MCNNIPAFRYVMGFGANVSLNCINLSYRLLLKPVYSAYISAYGCFILFAATGGLKLIQFGLSFAPKPNVLRVQ